MRLIFPSILTVASMLTPVYAAEAPSTDADARKDKKKDVVKKLIEVRLDPFLVAARAINIPLPGRVQTADELLEKLDKWGKDDEIGAILLNLDGLTLAMPDVQELRTGLAGAHKAGKKIVAFMNSGSDMDYLLACGADEIAMAPTGSMAIPGMGRIFPYMRGMYQMQGIEFDVITAGKFKYPGFVNQRKPNPAFVEEFNGILDSWFEDYVNIIAEGRKLPKEKVVKAIDVGLFDAEQARSHGLVDTIAYYDDFRDRILRREKFRKADDEASQLGKITSLQDLLTTISKEMKEAQENYKAVGPKIAVLHARGPIVDQSLGAGFASQLIQRDEFVKSIEEIRKNKTIRAVVLHIDSPGGSGYASDIIWRKLRELDEEKPLVVSMGTVAGSGGYYIACPARLIFAQPSTITGSIGVIAMLANQASSLNRRDIVVDEMFRGARALFGYGHKDMSREDREFLQKLILDFYEVFLDRVSVGRKMPKDEVRKIAEGRIYTGRQALKIGLVDRLGSLKDAIAAAREFASIPPSAEIKVVHYPRPSSLGELAESFLGMSAALDLAQNANRAAMPVPFDAQVRYFSRQPRPLCWMAMPDLSAALAPPPALLPDATIDVLSPVRP